MTIYLNPEDEITDVIEKLKEAVDKEIVFVVPESATLGTSLINFKLLKKSADGLGKSVSIVSDNSRVNLFAKGAQLNVQIEEGSVILNNPPAGGEGSNEIATSPTALRNDNPLASQPTHLNPLQTPNSNPQIQPNDLSQTAPRVLKNTPDYLEFNVPFIKFNPKIILGVGAAGLMLALIFFYIFAPNAEVKVYPKTDLQTASVDVTIVNGLSEAEPATNSVPGQLTEVKTEKRAEFTATGESKAKGKVELENTASGKITFPKGTTLINKDGEKEYVSDTGFSIDSGAKAEVSITAKETGESYNVDDGAGEFEVKDNDKIKGPSKGIAGGEKKVVSKDNFNDAKAKLEKEVLPKAESELKKKLPSGKLVESTIAKSTEARSVPKQNAVSDDGKFEMFVTVKVSAMVFDEDAVVGILTATVEKKLAEGNKLYELDRVSILYTPIKGGELKNGKVKIGVVVAALVGGVIDEKELAEALKGLSEGEAGKVLSDNDKIDRSEILHSPAWIKSMPRIVKNIKITIVVVPPEAE